MRTTCKLCLNYCGIIVHRTEEGIRLKGDPAHPLSKGFLCPKGLAALQIATHPARIRYPLRRAEARGAQRWERISWGEAIGEISSRLEQILERYGPEAILVNALPPKDPTIWLAFAKAIGTPNFFRHDHHICFTPQLIADNLTFGSLATYLCHTEEDAAKMRTVVLWGVNMPETNPAKALVIKEARRLGAKTIVVDPRPTRQAREADLWLRVRPGTDTALALGMLHVMMKEKLYDEEFVARWTYGFDELERHVEDYPSAKVAEITWVDEGSIVEAARLIATNKPSAIITFVGLTMGGNSIDAIRSLGLIAAVTGNVDVRGGNVIKVPPPTKRFSLSPEVLKRQISADRFPLLSGPFALTGPLTSPHPAHVVEAIMTGEPYPVKALLTNSNLLTSLEDSKRVLKVLLNLDLLVVFELFMTPRAEFADYVLPVTWFLESDAITEYMGLNFIAARSRAFEPIGEAREEGEVLLEILKSLGMSDRVPFEDYRGYLDYRLSPLGLDFDRFVKVGYVVTPYIERKYEKGMLRPDGKEGFNTPTGKVELYSTVLEDHGYNPLPVHREPSPGPYATPDLFKEYPFLLITGTRSLPFYHGLGLQIDKFRRLHPHPLIEISPDAASALGLQEGDWVILEVPDRDEGVKRKVHISPGLHDRVVCAEGALVSPRGVRPAAQAMGGQRQRLDLLEGRLRSGDRRLRMSAIALSDQEGLSPLKQTRGLIGPHPLSPLGGMS